ncbi:DUF3800 domain-containing protein [Patescibacteria group bacterium AH-259-L07]|nr:DUF3800 domain-containing protein [Patescibacteria group bacterium AH-259-L07]
MSKFQTSRAPHTFLFYDESGDTGTKFDSGSTRYFISTILVIPRSLVKQTTEVFTSIRSEYMYYSEFKYNKIKGDLLTDLVEDFSKIKGITAFSLIIDKTKYSGKSLTQEVRRSRIGRHKFSDFCIMHTLQKTKMHLRGKLKEGELYIDRIERLRESQFDNYIYSNVNKNSNVIGRITHVDSFCVPLIQMADIISGIIRDEVENKKAVGKDHTDLWRKIKKFTRIYNIETEINLKKLKVI